MQQWRVPAMDLTNNEQFNNKWEVPAYFKWYKQDITESVQGFFKYIFNDYYIPFAIGRAANAGWQQALYQWEEKATKFHINNSPLPKCTALKYLLLQTDLWDKYDIVKQRTINRITTFLNNKDLDSGGIKKKPGEHLPWSAYNE